MLFPAYTPLDYAIGRATFPQRPGRALVYSYGRIGPSPRTEDMFYVNLRDEKNTGSFGPYLPEDDIDEQYHEPAPVWDTGGFWDNLYPQLRRAVALGAKRVELDNLDTYTSTQVLALLDEVWNRYGLHVALKNPLNIYPDGVDLLALLDHPSVDLVIVEKGDYSPRDYQNYRKNSKKDKAAIPIRWVFFEAPASAEKAAQEIRSGGYVDMAVTLSPDDEYTDVRDIQLPFKPRDEVPMNIRQMRDDDPCWLKEGFSLLGTREVPGSGDNPTILAWGPEMAKRFPHVPGFADYTKTYTGDEIAWCGWFAGVCVSRCGILPPFGSTPTSRFMWAASWAYGTALGKSNPRRGCIAVFTRNGGGHVGFYLGEEGDRVIVLGGNQSDNVTVTSMSKSQLTGYYWPPEVTTQVKPSGQKNVKVKDVTATVFRDSSVAYSDVPPGWNERYGVSLPGPVASPRPQVRVTKGSKTIICDIVDKGPWNVTDDWFKTGKRPRVETQFRNKTPDDFGRIPTQDAGIDLTPAANAALGCGGKCKVDVEILWNGLSTEPDDETETQMETCMDPRVDQILEALEKLTGGKLTPERDPEPMSLLDILFGGKLTQGKKTITGILGLLGTLLGVEGGLVDPDGTTFDTLLTIFGAVTSVGFIAKIDRGIKIAQAISDTLKKLGGNK